MKLFPCPGCAAKDEIVARLDKRVEDLEKTLLAMVDPRAYALRYPKRRPEPLPPGNEPAPQFVITPQGLRAQPPYESPFSQAQVEAEFEEIRG